LCKKGISEQSFFTNSDHLLLQRFQLISTPDKEQLIWHPSGKRKAQLLPKSKLKMFRKIFPGHSL